MDAFWCATQDIGQRIAHGTMIFSIGIGLTATTINPHAMSYGYDRLRFIRPVHIGDTITTITTIADKRDHPKRAGHGVVTEKVDIRNQNGETVLACEHPYLVTRRPPIACSCDGARFPFFSGRSSSWRRSRLCWCRPIARAG